MRLLFSCRQPSQRKAQQTHRHLLFYNLPFNQTCIPPITCFATPTTHPAMVQLCPSTNLVFCFPFGKHAFSPSSNIFPPTQQRCNNFNPAYRSIPQPPNLLFVSFQWTYLFHCHQMPQTHFKKARSTCFPTAINLRFPHRFAKWCSKLLPFAQKPFCACLFAKQSMRFLHGKERSSLQLVAINIYNLRRIFAQKNPP